MICIKFSQVYSLTTFNNCDPTFGRRKNSVTSYISLINFGILIWSLTLQTPFVQPLPCYQNQKCPEQSGPKTIENLSCGWIDSVVSPTSSSNPSMFISPNHSTSSQQILGPNKLENKKHREKNENTLENPLKTKKTIKA